ncbi:MAG: DUF3048 domain-containing protein [Candidatus Peregrinibacteria bacterium]
MKKYFITLSIVATLVVASLILTFVVFAPGGTPLPHRGSGQVAEERQSFGSWLLAAMTGTNRRKSLVAVMVENQELARPHQEGVKDALLVWEFPVEGLISRFALVFDRANLPVRIGPVRSLRPYFIDALKPLVPAVIYAGGSPEAFAKVDKGDIVAKNLLYYYSDAVRDKTIPEPHNLFVMGKNVTALLKDDTLAATVWPPYVLGTAKKVPPAAIISLNFHNPVHDVRYVYDTLSDSYARSSGDVSDQGNPRNVLVLEMPIQDIGEEGRLTINVSGKGRAYLFHAGTVQKGTWSKTGLTGRFIFQTTEGKPFLFASGQTWVTSLPGMDRVKWN